jgi:hypothetical protein
MSSIHTIELGTMGQIDDGVFKKKIKIIYSGMPNPQTFALSPVIDKDAIMLEGYKYSPVIFYPIYKKNIKVLEKNFTVLDVDQEKIILQYLK